MNIVLLSANEVNGNCVVVSFNQSTRFERHIPPMRFKSCQPMGNAINRIGIFG